MSDTVVIEVSPPRGYSAYEIAAQHGYVGTEAEWNAAVNAARVAAEEAAVAASDSADSAAEDAQQTAADRVATGEDRVATGQDRAAAAGSAQTASSAAGTATTQAGIATDAADTAINAANTATTQAGIATTARNEAVAAREAVDLVKADIDARFLPDSATDPSADGLVGGELYYNTALNAYRYFNGAVFDYVTPDGDYLLL